MPNENDAERPAHFSPAEHFLPIRKTDLVKLLCEQPRLSPADRQAFRRLCHLLEATFHFEYHRELESLKDAYAPFDPDADTIAAPGRPAASGDSTLGELFEKFAWLLERANFQRLSDQDIEQALAACSSWGLQTHVDFAAFDRLEIHARGRVLHTRSRRDWKHGYRWRQFSVPTFQRLVVIFRLREDRQFGRSACSKDVHIKVFKDIPQMDLEMLLPGSRVKMSLVDRARIVLPTFSGLVLTVWKLVSGALAMAAAGVYHVMGVLGLIGGTFGYGVRSFFGYLRTKQRYQLSLTESLYYQNLDNNAGVLARLLDEAEEQENREAFLAYFFLWRFAPPEGMATGDLDERIEAFLQPILGQPVDFEVADAVAKLLRLGVAQSLPSGKLRAVPIEQALEALDRSWDNFFSYNAAA